MRIIPKDSKVKLPFYKGITIPDIIVGFVTLSLVALVIATNFFWRWYLAIGLILIAVPLYVKVADDRLYVTMWKLLRYLFSKKRYRGLKEAETLIPYIQTDGDLIRNKDSTYTGVIEIEPIAFYLLSQERQDYLIDCTISNILNSANPDEEWSLVKLDRPLILDKNIEKELKRASSLADLMEEGILTKEEYEARVDLIESRIDRLDEMNSSANALYPHYYLSLNSMSKNNITHKLKKAIADLAGAGIKTKRLGPKGLVDFIRYGNKEDFDERKTSIDMMDAPSLMNPKDVRFRLSSTIYNGIQVSYLLVNRFPMNVANAWGSRILNIPSTKAVMRMKPIERAKAKQRLDNAFMEIRSVYKSKVSDQFEEEDQVKSLAELLNAIQSSNETLFDTTLLLVVYDEIGRSDNKRMAKSILREEGFGFTEMVGMQEDAYISSFLSSVNRLSKMSHGIQTSSLSASLPFSSSRIGDEEGIYLGETAEPAFLDVFKRDPSHVNSNMVVIGQSGSGKSYATKTVLSNLASVGAKVYVLDPENEYGGLARSLGGTSIDVSSGKKGMLNPFQIMTTMDEGEGSNALYAHLQFLEGFYKVILEGIDMDSLELLNRLTAQLYKDKEIRPSTAISSLKPEQFPTFDELSSLIARKLESEKDPYAQRCLRVLENYTSKFSKGGRNSSLWNGYSTFSPSENFLAFDFQKLLASKNDVTANAQMLLILKWVENEVIKNRDRNIKENGHRRIVIAIDEAHMFIDERYPIALDFMYQLAKRIRKYDGMLVIVTQNVKDFMGTMETARKSMAIINVSQYSMIFALSPNDMTDLSELYRNAGGLNEEEKDSIVHAPLGHCFLISSPSERSELHIGATEMAEESF